MTCPLPFNIVFLSLPRCLLRHLVNIVHSGAICSRHSQAHQTEFRKSTFSRLLIMHPPTSPPVTHLQAIFVFVNNVLPPTGNSNPPPLSRSLLTLPQLRSSLKSTRSTLMRTDSCTSHITAKTLSAAGYRSRLNKFTAAIQHQVMTHKGSQRRCINVCCMSTRN